MKKIVFYLALSVSIGALASCAAHPHGRGNRGLPPGQAKKIFGTKSAKPFAPGQQKKKGKKHRGSHHRHDVHYFNLNLSTD
ncbi:quinol oxidase subunit 4 [Parapedobacter pyrenivorans]|uniref:quinol oxidase subunit 4 n=1 Tax=Parapedobacter pyrenivorans TaxID=1305674 RepID=UPI001667FAA4|nr:quinol oxidase subunit 4 [Parapedobacter pyrenivorans]